MTQTRNILSFAAAAITLSLTAAGVLAVPLDGADAGLGSADLAHRLGVSPLDVAAGPAAKGDFFERPGCFGQVWPDITPECLVKAAGAAAAPVRTVTMGYQIGEATTVLVRIPALTTATR
jgi:hypothetical protein